MRLYSSGFGFNMNLNMSSGYGDSNSYYMCVSEHRCVYITVIVVWLSELLIMYIIYVISKKDDLIMVHKRDTSIKCIYVYRYNHGVIM